MAFFLLTVFRGDTMKKIFTVFALAAALLFVVSCGGGNSKESDKTDTGETLSDDDTADTEPTSDTDPTGDTEPTETPDEDSTDTESTETPDNKHEVTQKECEDAGGTFQSGSPSRCFKYVECAQKPKHSEWNGNNKYKVEYKDGAWEEKEVATEYNEEIGDCHFVCFEYDGYTWDEEKGLCIDECYKAGGENEDGMICHKDIPCEEKPENSHWNGYSVYVIEYRDGEWEDKEFHTEYNEEEGICHFVCDVFYTWSGTECVDVCPIICGNVENLQSNYCFLSVDQQSYECHCKTGYEWHADTKTCESACEEGYYWHDGSAECVQDGCFNVVCGEHSDGICVRENNAGYHCGCETGYSWNSSAKACWKSDLCSNVVCGEHSTGSCTQTDAENYYCDCNTHYVWDGTQKKCIPDPCQNPDPCENMANSNGCIRLSDTEFECACNDGSYWNGTKCEECKEIDGNMWSPVYDPKDPNTASSFCNNLSVCGYDDWKLPSVGQLRTLFKNCSKTQTGGACGVSNRCMAASCDNSQCSCAFTSTDGYYSKLGDPASLSLWSRSKSSKDPTYWMANFGNASLESIQPFDNEFRCVRKTTDDYDPCEYQLCPTLSNTTGVCIPNSSNDGYTCGCNSNYEWSGSKCSGKQSGEVFCTGLPGNAEWNTVGSITQTWNGNTYVPSTTGEYNETASTSECRFKCKDNFGYDSPSNQCVGNTKRVNCTGLPANAQWNSVNSIIQTWRGQDRGWLPVTDSVYNAEPSTTECRFKCYEAHIWHTRAKQCVGAYAGGVYWSDLAEHLTWAEANEYCQNLDDGPWRLPTINELRAIVQNCPGTATGGACQITDSNPNYEYKDSNCKCEYAEEHGKYSRFGDHFPILWSSTEMYHNGHHYIHDYWTLSYREAEVLNLDGQSKYSVRCVKD